MLRALCESVRLWITANPDLAAALAIALTAAGCALSVLIRDVIDARRTMLLSEREAQALTCDQYRRERMERLVALQRRLKLRRSA